MYKDLDCTKLEPINKVAVKTYTREKIKIVESCKMFVVHPDTKVLQEVTLHVTSHEGSVIISCATSIALGLIHPNTNWDEVPEEGSLIYSKADMPKKQRNKETQTEKYVHMWPNKPNNVMQSVTNTEDRHQPNLKLKVHVETRTVNLLDVIEVQGDQSVTKTTSYNQNLNLKEQLN